MDPKPQDDELSDFDDDFEIDEDDDELGDDEEDQLLEEMGW